MQIDDENMWKLCVPCLNSINLAAEFMEMAKQSDDQINDILRKTFEEEQEKEEEEEDEAESDVEETPVDQIVETPILEIEENENADTIRARKRPRPMTFSKNGKGPKRTIPCLDPECPRLFSRPRDMAKHYNYSHQGSYANKRNTENSQQQPTDASRNTESDIEAWAEDDDDDDDDGNGQPMIQDLAISLVRCDQNEVKQQEDEENGVEIHENDSVRIKSEPQEEEGEVLEEMHSIFSAPETQPRKGIRASTGGGGIGGDHKCEICHLEFIHFAQLLQHKSTHEETETSQLTIQPNSATTIANFDETSDAFKCNHCPETFNLRWLLLRHLADVHGIVAPPHESRNSKSAQNRINSGKKIFKPKFINGKYHCCGFVYLDRRRFNCHKSKHHPEHVQVKSCYCNICLVRVESRKALIIHYREAHAGAEKEAGLTCHWCERTFNSKKLAFSHKRKMHPELFDEN